MYDAHLIAWLQFSLHFHITPEVIQDWMDHLDEREEARLCQMWGE